MKSGILLSFFLSVAFPAFAQQAAYQPLSTDCGNFEEIKEEMARRYELDEDALPKRHRREMREAYEGRYLNMLDRIEKHHFIFDEGVTAYFDGILSKVLKANPEIPKQEDIKLFVSRYASPNAACVGEGSIVVNVGLIRRLRNEGEFAFVLCHELAHYSLDHVNHAIAEQMERLYGAETQRELRSISASRYGKMQQALELLKGIAYEDGRHSRLHESVADSLGLAYLKKAGYETESAYTALQLLDKIDEEEADLPLNLRQTFDTPGNPFRERWLEAERGLVMQDTKDEWHEDSLKTHPDCSKRMAAISRQLKLDTAGISPQAAGGKYAQMMRMGDFEMVEGYNFVENYGATLYHSLKLLGRYPDDVYLHNMVGNSLLNIYNAQKEHRLGRHVALPSPDHQPEYKSLLHFIENLRLSDIANLGYHFLKDNEAKCGESEEFLFAIANFCKILDRYEEKIEYTDKYRQLFPDGKHLDDIRKL